MTIFIDTEFHPAVCLSIVGEKAGTVHGETIEDACNKLLKYLTKDDTAYIDIGGAGIVVADILSRYVNVFRVKLKNSDMIKE